MARKSKQPAKIIDNSAIDDAANGTGGFQAFYGKAAQLQSRKDILQNSTFTRTYRLPQEVCENVYMDTWIGKKIVTLPVSRAMRNGLMLEIEGDKDGSKEKKVWDLYKKYNIESLASAAQSSADVYGSAIILLKDRTQDPLKKAGDYKTLEIEYVEFPFFTVSPRQNNPYAPGMVSFSMLGISADESYCAPFVGVPTLHRLSPSFKYFGMSVFQSIWTALVNDQTIMTAAANIVYRSSIRSYKLKGLQSQVLAGRADQALARTSLLDETVGIFGSAVMDAEDDMQIVSQAFAGLPEMDRRSGERLAAATGIPATLLLGKSPDGQNSTGKSDEANMNAYTAEYQKKMLPPIQRIFAALISLAGIQDKWKVSFKSPAVIDIAERPTHDKQIIENSQQLQTMGLPQDVVLRYMLENNIITQDEHDRVELAVNQYDDLDKEENETDAT